MHTFLTGIFEGVVFGIAMLLLLASIELRKADLNRGSSNGDGFEGGPTSPSQPGKPICLDLLAAQSPSIRANDSPSDYLAVRPDGRLSRVGLTLR